MIAAIYFKIGLLVWFYYITMNRKRYFKALHSGDLTLIDFLIGLMGTIFLWPVTIYNQEFRYKD